MNKAKSKSKEKSNILTLLPPTKNNTTKNIEGKQMTIITD